MGCSYVVLKTPAGWSELRAIDREPNKGSIYTILASIHTRWTPYPSPNQSRTSPTQQAWVSSLEFCVSGVDHGYADFAI
jgi:hypothetical protein